MDSGDRGENARPLAGVTVVDLTEGWGEYCGRVLADLGARVLKIEPPGGHPARSRQPWCEQHDHSLYWTTIALGCDVRTIDLDAAAGREELLGLIGRADVVVESWVPGEAGRRGLDYATLAKRWPQLVVASVTSHGQRSLRSSVVSSDLTVEVEAGLVAGDGDRPPIPIGFPQATFHAGLQCATDVLAALYGARSSGVGQYLDVSALASLVPTLLAYTGYPAFGLPDEIGTVSRRAASREVEGVRLPEFLRCRDGNFFPVFRGAPRSDGGTHSTLAHFVAWGYERGAIDERLGAVDWSDWERKIIAGVLRADEVQEAELAAEAFILATPLDEIMAWTRENQLPCSPILSLDGLFHDEHLSAIGFWRDVDGHVHPGPFARMNAATLGPEGDSALRRPISSGEEATSSRHVRVDAIGPIFAGLKVADFTWAGTGPRTAKYFADHGATVVHVESATHLDTLRQAGAMKDGVAGVNRSHFFSNMNTSKLGLALDIGTDEGVDVARKLIDWADVVVESYSPGAMARKGLDYDAVVEGHEDLVMVSTSLRGAGGPQASLRGYGTTGAALSGLHGVTGWPDRAPCGPGRAYTDAIVPHFLVSATIAALWQRRETGRGQHVEISQIEASTHFIEPLVLDFTVNNRDHAGRAARPFDPGLQGVYRARGEERYVAVSALSADQWSALATFLGRATGTWPPVEGEVQKMDEVLAERLEDDEPWAAARALRDAGVAASAVQWPADVLVDPELKVHGYFVALEHPETGTALHDGFATRFSLTPPVLRSAGPCLGADNDVVLREILGLSDDQILALEAAKALH